MQGTAREGTDEERKALVGLQGTNPEDYASITGGVSVSINLRSTRVFSLYERITSYPRTTWHICGEIKTRIVLTHGKLL